MTQPGRTENGQFAQGNDFWRYAKNPGRHPKFRTAKALWKKCCEYFEWVQDNPLYASKPMSSGRDIEVVSYPVLRAMTVTALQLYIGLSEQGWLNYKERPDFVEVCTRVEKIIYSQKFEGAAGGLLNHAIIARDLGLKDKKELSTDPDAPIGVTVYMPANGRD